jgi:hypothetical protein
LELLEGQLEVLLERQLVPLLALRKEPPLGNWVKPLELLWEMRQAWRWTAEVYLMLITERIAPPKKRNKYIS